MPKTHYESHEFCQKDHVTTKNTRLFGIALFLIMIAAALVLFAALPGGSGNRIALAGASEASASPSPSPCLSPNSTKCDALTEWPTAFEIPFTLMHYERFQNPPKFGEWKGNLLRYQRLKLARDIGEFATSAVRQGEFIMYLYDPGTKLSAMPLPLRPTMPRRSSARGSAACSSRSLPGTSSATSRPSSAIRSSSSPRRGWARSTTPC